MQQTSQVDLPRPDSSKLLMRVVTAGLALTVAGLGGYGYANGGLRLPGVAAIPWLNSTPDVRAECQSAGEEYHRQTVEVLTLQHRDDPSIKITDGGVETLKPLRIKKNFFRADLITKAVVTGPSGTQTTQVDLTCYVTAKANGDVDVLIDLRTR